MHGNWFQKGNIIYLIQKTELKPEASLFLKQPILEITIEDEQPYKKRSYTCSSEFNLKVLQLHILIGSKKFSVNFAY